MVGNVSPRLLWQNLAHVLYLRHPAWIEEHEDPEIKENLRKDYDWLWNLPPEKYEAADHFRQVYCIKYRINSYCPECPVLKSANVDG